MSEFFSESCDPSVKFKVNRTLHEVETPFQTLKVVESESLGKVMILDGCVMTSDKDEFVYHEMITHVPLAHHNSPESVLVIGGGDGGTVRELLKYRCIKSIILCEIDACVIDASRRFFPQLSEGFDNPRVEMVIGDGIEYIKKFAGYFDLVIVDSTDPQGPGEPLFTKQFYSSVERALKPCGIMVAQSESPWAEKELLLRIYNNISAGLAFAAPYVGPVPTYPFGLWSWTLGSKREISLKDLGLNRFAQIQDTMSYLTLPNLKNCFELPVFYERKLDLRR